MLYSTFEADFVLSSLCFFTKWLIILKGSLNEIFNDYNGTTAECL